MGICTLDEIMILYFCLVYCFIFCVKLVLYNSRRTECREKKKWNGDESVSYDRIMRIYYYSMMSKINVTG